MLKATVAALLCWMSPVAWGVERNVDTVVEFEPVDLTTGEIFSDVSWGAIDFFATDADGNIYRPDRENKYRFTEAGTYTIGGESVHNICYPDSTQVIVDANTVYVKVRIFVGCE